VYLFPVCFPFCQNTSNVVCKYGNAAVEEEKGCVYSIYLSLKMYKLCHSYVTVFHC